MSNMQHLFSQIPRADIQRSVFNRPFTLKTAFDSGYLVPIFADEALPGDTFTLNSAMFARLTTMAVPVMDNLYLQTFFFSVPYRLVWSHWQAFCGEQANPGDSTDYLLPILTHKVGGSLTDPVPAVGSLSDYLGLPPGVGIHNVTSLWHRAYNLVWNEWFRDENLQDRAFQTVGDGPDEIDDFPLRKRGKRKDYFTSALPWPQKGPGVEIGLAGSAPVWGSGSPLQFYGLGPSLNTASSMTEMRTLHRDSSIANLSQNAVGTATPVNGYKVLQKSDATTTNFMSAPADAGLVADLNGVSAVTINNLRTAFQIQRLYEADARGGTRYTEILRSHFGVVSPDARLQRPEYLGGNITRIQVHPVAQQSATTDLTPQGNLAAFATVGSVNRIFHKSFTEHTLVLGLACVFADLTYQQGIPRMFSRRTRFDFYWPTLAHLGEQAILNKEIYAQGTSADNEVFGYQERWAEYRYKPSMITGKLRSQVSDSLDVWHLAQEFDSLPGLNSDFIEEDVPLDRVLAVTGDQPQIWADFSFDFKAARPMPVYSVPGLIDHF